MNQYPYYPANRIQNISSYNANEVLCYYVSNPKDMDKLQVNYGTLYIGINNDKKELYIRQMNSNGLIDVNTYVLQSGEQQKNEYTVILEKLDELTKGVGNVHNQSANGAVNVGSVVAGQVTESPSNATV